MHIQYQYFITENIKLQLLLVIKKKKKLQE